MQEHEFKYGSSIFNFEEMIVYVSSGGFWRLKFNYNNNKLYRLGSGKMNEQSPIVNQAYLDYMINKTLLGE